MQVSEDHSKALPRQFAAAVLSWQRYDNGLLKRKSIRILRMIYLARVELVACDVMMMVLGASGFVVGRAPLHNTIPEALLYFHCSTNQQ